MFGIGLPELILIMALALIVVGPDKLPELARSIAKGVLELKRTVESLKQDLSKENPLDSVKPEIEDAARSLRKQLGDAGPDGYTGVPAGYENVDPHEQAIRSHDDEAQEVVADVGEADTAAAPPEKQAAESPPPSFEPDPEDLIENEAGVETKTTKKTDPPSPDQTVH